MEWSDVRIFLAIAREGSLGAAARAVGQTQPTMGRRLRALEASVGQTLFQRTADGFVLGPFTVSAGAIDLGDSYTAVLVGRWQAPRFETMPQVFVTPGDDVIFRPGRIHTVEANIMDTTSIAIGARPPMSGSLMVLPRPLRS